MNLHDEYLYHDDQLDDNHGLTSYQSVEQDKTDDHESDEESSDTDDVDVVQQCNHFDNADGENADDAEDIDEESVGTPGVEKAVENPGVDTEERTRRSNRYR